MFINSESHGRFLEEQKQKVEAARAGKEARTCGMWDKHRESIQSAEQALCDASSLEDLAASRGGVAHLKMLILSRTGKHAKAKNNKCAAGEDESDLIKEARAAIQARSTTPLP